MQKPDFFTGLRYGKQWGYETLFKTQDTRPVGKVGVIFGEAGMPEDYEFEPYRNYMHHVFQYTVPGFVFNMIMADKGVGLIDPENPVAREAFKPKQLIDAQGSFTNKAGKPYAECEVTWKKPGQEKNHWDHGYFLYTGEGPSGDPDICEKVGAKVVGWYYGHLIPEKKVAWRYQCRKVVEEAAAALGQKYPGMEFRQAAYTVPEQMEKAVEELIATGCQTIIYQCISNPVYTDFEEYGYALPMILHAAHGRAKVICADQLGNQSHLREAYFRMLRDRLASLPKEASVFVILSKHGHPFKKETQDIRGKEYREPLEAGIRQIMQERGGRWDLIWSNDEYADEFWDPKNTKLETYTAYRMAIEGGYDYALEFPTEFLAENTDLMIFHAMKKFNAFESYDRNDPVPYPDWDQPLVRTFREGKTTGIYNGTPVGPYRDCVTEAVVGSISDVMGKA